MTRRFHLASARLSDVSINYSAHHDVGQYSENNIDTLDVLIYRRSSRRTCISVCTMMHVTRAFRTVRIGAAQQSSERGVEALKEAIHRLDTVEKDSFFFFFQAEDGIRDVAVTGVQTCALPI